MAMWASMSSDVIEAARLKRWEACATAWAAITCSTAHAGLAPVATGSLCVVQAPRQWATAWAATSCGREHADLHPGNSSAVHQAGSKT